MMDFGLKVRAGATLTGSTMLNNIKRKGAIKVYENKEKKMYNKLNKMFNPANLLYALMYLNTLNKSFIAAKVR